MPPIGHEHRRCISKLEGRIARIRHHVARFQVPLIRDQRRFRRHEGACPFYRENWVAPDPIRAVGREVVLYEIYCLRETPPETVEEQHVCMLSELRCWRDGLSHRTALRQEREREEAESARAS